MSQTTDVAIIVVSVLIIPLGALIALTGLGLASGSNAGPVFDTEGFIFGLLFLILGFGMMYWAGRQVLNRRASTSPN